MNLIEEIARRVANGLKAAEVAVGIEVEHGVKVGEDWVRKIMGADGFSAALSEAQQAIAAKVDAVGSEVASELESFDESHEQDSSDTPAQAEGVEKQSTGTGTGAVDTSLGIGGAERVSTTGGEVEAKSAENTTLGEKTIELAKELGPGSGEPTPGAALENKPE